MRPVGWTDLADLIALKGDPRSFAAMLGGVCGPVRVAEELAADIAFWAANGFGMWILRSREDDRFVGFAGLHIRSDGRGVALRFALMPNEHGCGFASEAGGSILRFGHERAELSCVLAIAREDNIASRQVLGAIGMVENEMFLRDGIKMVVYESRTDNLENKNLV